MFADLQSMQFTINKLFGRPAMSQNYYQKVSNYFGINTVKELIYNRVEKFRIIYGAADNRPCRLIYLLDAELIMTACDDRCRRCLTFIFI